MRVIKKINNNVAICIDRNNTELVAFGKGIGFPKVPYDILDLSKITMTFYRIDSRFYQLIEEIPENVFEVATLIIDKAQRTLNSSLNPNLIVTLSDHIHFAIMRTKKYKKMKMLFSYDVEQLYPKETELGKYAVELILEKLYVKLPDSEITSIAMHFINAIGEQEPEEGADTEGIITEAVDQIEKTFSINIDRTDFNFNRFAMHLRYYLKRIKEDSQFIDDSTIIIETMKEKKPKVYECALIIGDLIDKRLNSKSTKEELLYLMIHITRMISKTTIED